METMNAVCRGCGRRLAKKYSDRGLCKKCSSTLRDWREEMANLTVNALLRAADDERNPPDVREALQSIFGRASE